MLSFLVQRPRRNPRRYSNITSKPASHLVELPRMSRDHARQQLHTANRVLNRVGAATLRWILARKVGGARRQGRPPATGLTVTDRSSRTTFERRRKPAAIHWQGLLARFARQPANQTRFKISRHTWSTPAGAYFDRFESSMQRGSTASDEPHSLARRDD